MAGKNGKPTPKQEVFAREYIIDHNATAAYRRAGYKAKTARAAESSASEILRNPNVQARIAELQEERNKRFEIEADDILRELCLLAKSDIGDILDFSGNTLKLRKPSDIPEHARRAIASVKIRHETGAKIGPNGIEPVDVELIEFKLWNKPSAVYKALQHLGLLKDCLEVTGKGGGAVQHTHEHRISFDDFCKLSLTDRIRVLREQISLPSGN